MIGTTDNLSVSHATKTKHQKIMVSQSQLLMTMAGQLTDREGGGQENDLNTGRKPMGHTRETRPQF